MLGLGIVSRIASGMIADKIGGLGTIMLGAALQCVALAFYIPFDGLMTLYVVIYCLWIYCLWPVRARTGRDRAQLRRSYGQYFPASEADTRVSLVLMTTVISLAIGGWMSGEIFGLTGRIKSRF